MKYLNITRKCGTMMRNKLLEMMRKRKEKLMEDIQREICYKCNNLIERGSPCVKCFTLTIDIPDCTDSSTSSTGSLRYNKGKPEMSQLDPQFLLDLADLITKSAEKYGKFNYAKGQDFSTPYDSCMRHLLEFQKSNDYDKESQKSHVLHAAANLMILYGSFIRHKELDDRAEEFKEKK